MKYLLLMIGAGFSATCGDPSGVDRVASDIVVVPSSVDLDQLESIRLTGYVVDQNGDKVGEADVTFSTTTPGVVTVTPSGLVAADGMAGAGVIKANFGTLERAISVLVHPVPTRLAVVPGPSLVIPFNTASRLSITVYDANDDVMYGPVTLTSTNPSVVTVNNSGDLTTFGSAGTATVTVDAGALQKSTQVRVADFQRQNFLGGAYGVAVSLGNVALVAALSGPMGRIELPAPQIVGTLPIVATGVVFDDIGATAYAAGYFGSGIPVIDVALDSVVDSLGSFQATRFAVIMSLNNQQVYVGTNGGLVAIDIATGATTDVPVGSYVNHLSRHPVQPLIYATMPDYTRVLEINTNTNAIVRTFQLPLGTVVQATGVSVNGNRLFIANESGRMDTWDLNTNTQLPPLSGIAPAFGLTVSPDGSSVYLSGGGVVQVVSTATLQVTTTYVTGGTPRAVAFNPAGTIAVSANESGWVDFLP